MYTPDIRIPVTHEEKLTLQGAANVSGIRHLSSWARMVLLQEARRVAEDQGREDNPA
jgi:hypothetical protein